MTLSFRNAIRGGLASAGLAALAVGQNANAATVPTFFDTGVTVNNGTSGGPGTNAVPGTVDTHYTITSVAGLQSAPPSAPIAGNVTGVTPSAFVLNPATFPVNIYNTVPGGQYIAPAVDSFSPGGTFYDYRTTFDLTGFIPSTASLSGAAASDDVIVEAFLNGNRVLGPIGNPTFNAVVPFTFSSGFVSGVNTLDFIVFNSTLDQVRPTTNPSAFVLGGLPNANGAVLTATAVPEPGSVAMLMGIGVSGAGFLIRRKRRA